MKSDEICVLTDTFEGHAQQTENGIEYWLARDLQHLLGYTEWRNFLTVANKAKTACEVVGYAISDHFVDVNKMVDIGSGVQREIDDVMLTRYACYLIAQNGDPRKPEIAFAQTYFALQTRKAELIEQRLLEVERLVARKKLTETEKDLFCHRSANGECSQFRNDSQQGRSGPLREIDPGDESSMESSRGTSTRELCPNNRAESQRLRDGNHDLQRSRTRPVERRLDLTRTRL